MAEPFLGQIVAVAFSYAPNGWAVCDGSLVQIAQNTALFSLLGTTFGGDGLRTFALPDLRGRAALGAGQGTGLSAYPLGQAAGAEQVALTSGQFAAHTHALEAAGAATSAAPGSALALGVPATSASIYAASGTSTTLAPSAVGPGGGQGQPHENRQPSLTITYIIALEGVYPTRN